MRFPDKPLPNHIRILGIDPGTDTLGVCIMDVDIDTYAPVVTWGYTFHASRETDDWAGYAEGRGLRDARLKALSRFMTELLYWSEPTIIAAESPFFNRTRPSAFEALVECYAMLRDTVWAYSPTLELKRIDPVTAKNYIGVDHRGTDKNDVQRAIVLKFASMCADGVQLNRFDEHSIDAVAVSNAIYRMVLLGEVVERTKKTKRVGKKPRSLKTVKVMPDKGRLFKALRSRRKHK